MLCALGKKGLYSVVISGEMFSKYTSGQVVDSVFSSSIFLLISVYLFYQLLQEDYSSTINYGFLYFSFQFINFCFMYFEAVLLKNEHLILLFVLDELTPLLLCFVPLYVS